MNPFGFSQVDPDVDEVKELAAFLIMARQRQKTLPSQQRTIKALVSAYLLLSIIHIYRLKLYYHIVILIKRDTQYEDMKLNERAAHCKE